VRKRVAVVEHGVDNGSGNNGGCFEMKAWTDTYKADDNGNSGIWRQMRFGQER